MLGSERPGVTDDVLRTTLGSVAPGTTLREGLERILRGRTGALVVVGLDKAVEQMSTGGFVLNVPFTATALRELAKMDGAIILDREATTILRAGVHLMPDPSVATDGSGIRCTPARKMVVASRSRMIAPSILASSRSAVAVNGTFRTNPPVDICSTALSSPTTTSAPVRPRRMRSSPSRKVVPGATEPSVVRRTSSVTPGRSDPSTKVSPSGLETPSLGLDTGHSERCGSGKRLHGLGDVVHSCDGDGTAEGVEALGACWHDGTGEADAFGLAQAGSQVGDRANLAG